MSKALGRTSDGWGQLGRTGPNERHMEETFADVMSKLYGVNDPAFLSRMREMGRATDDMIVAADELVDGVRETVGALKRLVVAGWRQQRASWALRRPLAEAVRKMRADAARGPFVGRAWGKAVADAVDEAGSKGRPS